MTSLNIDDLDEGALYLLLSLRGAEPGFHWALWVPTALARIVDMEKRTLTDSVEGWVGHAVNRSGGWEREVKFVEGVPYAMSLCLCQKVGGFGWRVGVGEMVERVDVERVVGVFDGVPYGGDGVGGGEEEEGEGQGDIQGKKGEEKERNGSGKGERRFSCRTWIQDALQALHDAGVIDLPKHPAEIMNQLVVEAEVHRETVESGAGPALVVNTRVR